MTLTFRYKDVPRPNKTRASTPSVPVTLSGGGMRYDFMALLDSGADVSAIPKQVAELLGLDLTGPRDEAFGIGGSVQAVQSQMHVEIGKRHERYEFTIPVKVVMNDYDFPPLIGRAIFFDRFVITFRQKERKVILKPVP